MKKFINEVDQVEKQMIEGLAKAYPQYVKRLGDSQILVRAEKKEGKVALISGGGSGHEPAHGGFVGYGMLDAAVAGAVFTSPGIEGIEEAIQAVKTEAGVLLIIKNYTGDVLNFQMAKEMAEAEGVKMAQVVVADDVAIDEKENRRGVAGTLFVHKLAGAMAEKGASLEEVHRVAQKVADNVRSMGVAIKPCTVPANGKPSFELADDEMEVGIGIHGEPGIRREKLRPVDEVVDILLDRILGDLDYAGHDLAVLVNGFGGTPLMELAVANAHVSESLEKRGLKVFKTEMGNFMTSLDMAGLSISILRLDDELKELLLAPANTPSYRLQA